MKINFYKSSFENKKISEFFNRYRMLKKILPRKKIICFDIGANEGQTILEISKNFQKVQYIVLNHRKNVSLNYNI